MSNHIVLTNKFFEKAPDVMAGLRDAAQRLEEAVSRSAYAGVAMFAPHLSSPGIDAIAHGELNAAGQAAFLKIDAITANTLLEAYHRENAVMGISRPNLDEVLADIPNANGRRASVIERFVRPAAKLD